MSNNKDIKILAKLLDNQFKGPFNSSIGLDSIIGIIPFWGDLFTLVLSLYIFIRAISLGCSINTLIRMLINSYIDFVIGSIPIAGDIFDIYWQSNTKNVALLERQLISSHKVNKESQLFLISLSVALILAFLVITFFTIKLLAIILSLFF